MPIYDFKCKRCAEVFEIVCSISARDQQQCPHCGSAEYEAHHAQIASIGDPVRLGVRTMDGGFKEVLSKIHSANYKSNLASKLSRS